MRKLGLLVLMAAACGGGTAGTPATTTGGGSTAHTTAREDKVNDGVCSPESLEEVQRFFRSHNRMVTTCYSDARREGKVPKEAEGRVTADMTIDGAGRPQDVHIATSAFKSEEMNACIVHVISGWTVPKPDVPFHFSFSYEFHAE